MFRAASTGFLVTIMVAATCCSLVSSSPQNGSGKYNAHSKLPSIFEFESYKVRFEKHYKSHLEEVTRKVYFYAKALAVYVAALAYKMRKSSHYLALNEMSDWSKQELDSMSNRVLAGESESDFDQKASPQKSVSEHEAEILVNKVEEGIWEKLQETNAESALGDQSSRRDGDEASQNWSSKRQRRQKRSPSKRRRSRKGPRQLSMDKLVQGNAPVQEPAQVLAKVERNPTSNNPQYDEFGLERDTRGLIDEQEDVELLDWVLPLPSESGVSNSGPSSSSASFQDEDDGENLPKSSFEKVKDLLMRVSWNFLDFYQEDQDSDDDDDDQEEREDDLENQDKMFVDLRESGCLFQPRNQGRCGSCYAFAGVTLAEFIFCKATKHLYAFSEQYLVDCGNKRIYRMNGCDGAIDEAVPKFIHNFGLELRDRYPYTEREEQCPYGNWTKLATTGYIKMKLDNELKVPVEAWPEVLKHSPIYVGVAPTPDFSQYGGGIEQGRRCGKVANHAMLVVGHGREDGQEFWLIRNSYGVHWGDQGNWKLAKSAPARCIEYQQGRIWASKDAVNYHAEPKLNTANINVQTELAAQRKKRVRYL